MNNPLYNNETSSKTNMRHSAVETRHVASKSIKPRDKSYLNEGAQTKWLSHESLIVYDMALKFHIAAMTLLPKRGYTNLRDQLERASLSIVLNIAEGAGRSSGADRKRFFTIAMGSLLECGAMLEVLRRRRISDPVRCRNGRLYLIQIARMLSRLATSQR